MRLIDVDAWWEEAQKLYTDGDCADADRYKVGINVGISASRAVMHHLPSIDLVRCKECKHRHTIDCFRAYLEYDIQEWVVDSGEDDDFCSYGERREP